jgi:single-strand DNA-binding protein
MLGAPRGGGGAGADMDGEGSHRPSRVPAAQKAKATAGGEDFEDFPGALEDEDDDLPF